MKLLLLVFCPFAAGYFLSFFFRNVNAVISRDLAREFSLSPSDLGLLTSMYLLAFGAIQLPLGVLLDRYGPRRVVAALLCVAAAGALTFGLARDFTLLCAGRALIGLGVSAGLMGAIKAFTLWFPLSRLATLNGIYLGVGGLGALAATAPAEAILAAWGWRSLFCGMAAVAAAAALAVFFVVPEKRLPGAAQPLAAQIGEYRAVFCSVGFWRLTAALVICHATYLALQGLWLAPWLYDVAGLDRASVARYLLVTALAYAAGSVFFGVGGDWLARAGFAHLSTFKWGLAVQLVLFALIGLAAPRGATLATLLALYGFSSISASLAYAVYPRMFPVEMTGRVATASNVLMFGCAFAFQWGIGAILKLHPVVDGGYAPQGYVLAFALLAALQVAALAALVRFSAESKRTPPSPGSS